MTNLQKAKEIAWSVVGIIAIAVIIWAIGVVVYGDLWSGLQI